MSGTGEIAGPPPVAAELSRLGHRPVAPLLPGVDDGSTAVDLEDRKLDWARGFGATHTANARENDPVEAIRELSGEVSVIVVAHRLATIRHSEQVCFMRDGELVASGSFAEVVAAQPDFAQ